MQETSALYKELLSGRHWKETRLSIGDTGRLVDKSGNRITFGGTGILVAASGTDGGYNESVFAEDGISTTSCLFDDDTPAVGCCVSGEIDVKMLKPAGRIEGLSRIAPYTRLTDGVRHSEWLPQGVYFLSSAYSDADEDDVQWTQIHGFDAMRKAEQDYPSSKLQWPATDIDVVREIADAMGVSLDPRTVEIMTAAYPVEYSPDLSCREMLSYISAMYGGCFIMSEKGELRLVCFWDIPKETRYLINNAGYAITFGGVRILV